MKDASNKGSKFERTDLQDAVNRSVERALAGNRAINRPILVGIIAYPDAGGVKFQALQQEIE